MVWITPISHHQVRPFSADIYCICCKFLYLQVFWKGVLPPPQSRKIESRPGLALAFSRQNPAPPVLSFCVSTPGPPVSGGTLTPCLVCLRVYPRATHLRRNPDPLSCLSTCLPQGHPSCLVCPPVHQQPPTSAGTLAPSWLSTCLPKRPISAGTPTPVSVYLSVRAT